MSLESAHLSISQPHQTHFVKFHPCPGERHSQEAEQWLKRTTSASGLAVVAVEVARAVAVHARHEARRRVPHRLFGKRWGWASVPTLDIKHKYRTGHATHSIVLVLQACAYAIGHEKTREHSPCPPATGRMPLRTTPGCVGAGGTGGTWRWATYAVEVVARALAVKDARRRVVKEAGREVCHAKHLLMRAHADR